ncbi:MAG: hypothetical protein SH868_11585 [Bythopirellula sp.]|nr:hypothetical protein [Bythopirellula sp.]
MKRLLCAVLLVVLSPLLAAASHATSEAITGPAKIDPRLRSAFLLRAVGMPQEYRQANAAGLRTQLQTHFDAVLEKLAANRERSLVLALARLEQRQGVRWSAAQREYWYGYLSHQRKQNIERLVAYRDRALFPLNEGHADEGAPIFVDRHDTACAVGHLMRESGWRREVELIATTNLLVYVTDVSSGPVANWVLQSGLTQGEAALIQPQYAPPIAQIPLSTLSAPGSGFTAPATFFNGTEEQTIANGLRYENFRLRRLTNITSTPGPYMTEYSGIFFPLDGGIEGTWQQDTPSNIGVRTDYDVVYGRPDCDICFTDYYAAWPYANLLTLAPGADSYAISQGLSAVAISFDVVASHPTLSIDRVGSFIANGFSIGAVEAWTYVSLPPTTVEVIKFPNKDVAFEEEEPDVTYTIQPIVTQVNSPGNLLATLHVAPWNNPSVPYEDSVTFSPAERVTVHSFILTRNSQFSSGVFGAISHEIRVSYLAPEPSSLLLLNFVSVWMLICRRGTRW